MQSLETILLNLLVIVAVAIVARTVSVQFRGVPYSAVLVTAGLVVSALQYDFAISLSHDLILFILLPPILFAGSFRLDVPRFRRNLPLIALLLLVALPVSVVLMGVVWHFVYDFPWIAALLLGAMLYPLDPAAVLAIFKEMDLPDQLLAIIEGEPLFDDGLAVVIYSTLITILQSGQGQALADQLLSLSVLRDFVVVSVGGLGVGGLLAAVVFVGGSHLIKDKSADLLMSVLVVYGSVLIAEHYLHVSGIMAVVAAGVTARIAQERRSLPSGTDDFVRSNWEMAEFMVNTFAYLLVGALVDLDAMLANWHLILFGTGLFLVVRGVMVYTLIPLGNQFLADAVPMKYGRVLVWGALHTVVPILMALGLPEETPSRSTLQTVVFGVAVVSILVQGLTISTVLRRSGTTE